MKDNKSEKITFSILPEFSQINSNLSSGDLVRENPPIGIDGNLFGISLGIALLVVGL